MRNDHSKRPFEMNTNLLRYRQSYSFVLTLVVTLEPLLAEPSKGCTYFGESSPGTSVILHKSRSRPIFSRAPLKSRELSLAFSSNYKRLFCQLLCLPAFTNAPGVLANRLLNWTSRMLLRAAKSRFFSVSRPKARTPSNNQIVNRRNIGRDSRIRQRFGISVFSTRSRLPDFVIDTRKMPVRHCAFRRKSLKEDSRTWLLQRKPLSSMTR